MLRDFHCAECGFIAEDIFTTIRGLTEQRRCPSCVTGWLEALPAAPAFAVKGYSAKNGYTSKSNT